MTCNDIEQRLKNLRNEKQDLEEGMELVTNSKALAIMQANLDNLKAQIAAEEKKTRRL